MAVQAERRPTVNLTSNYSRIAYPEVLLPAFNRTNWSIGASVTMPFMTGGRQKGDEMVARADVEQARIQLRQMEELAALDTRSAWAELVAARAAWTATSGTVQQATRAYEIAEVRYPGRPLDTARAERCPAAVAAGRGQSSAGGARPAGGPSEGGAAAQPAPRGRYRQPGTRPDAGPVAHAGPDAAATTVSGRVGAADRRRATGSEIDVGNQGIRVGVVVLAAGVLAGCGAGPDAPAAAGAPCRRADWTGERRHGRVWPNRDRPDYLGRAAAGARGDGPRRAGGLGDGRAGGGRAAHQAGRGDWPHRDANARGRAPVGRLGAALGREPAGAGAAGSGAHRATGQGGCARRPRSGPGERQRVHRRGTGRRRQVAARRRRASAG